MKRLVAALALVSTLFPSVTAAGGIDLRKLFHKPRMALPQGFPEGFDVIPCTRASNWLSPQPVACGPFRVTQFHYAWTRPGRLSQLHRLATRREMTYSFRIEVGRSLAWEGLCRQAKAAFGAVLEGEHSSVEVSNLVVSVVQCYLCDMETLAAWTLDLRTDIHPYLLSADIESVGSLVSGETRLEVAEAHAIDGLSLPSGWPVGFLFSRDGRWVAAADAGPAGGLRLDPAAERGPVVAGCAALLLRAALASGGFDGDQ
jgi:hypothetical protein